MFLKAIVVIQGSLKVDKMRNGQCNRMIPSLYRKLQVAFRSQSTLLAADCTNNYDGN
jgi:hypothetical protein